MRYCTPAMRHRADGCLSHRRGTTTPALIPTGRALRAAAASRKPTTPRFRRAGALPGGRTVAALPQPTSAPATPDTADGFPYKGVIFDMDGTLTDTNIDFVDMRKRTGIKQGDLFTVMESWDEDTEITRAMDVILEIEADAQTRLTLQEGLVDLLMALRDLQVPVALVTRNTTSAVNAFFSLLGEEWRPLFSQILTREYRYIKPDKRLLLDVAKVWGLPPNSLLMVGDSIEDVECGNAAGTATCHIQGGGNEVGAAAAALPVGAIPTFSVASLTDLRRRLEAGDVSDGQENAGLPPKGLDFLDAIFDECAILTGSCSFWRLATFGGGLIPVGKPGERVLHLCCGDGGMTKLLASQGVTVMGVDTNVDAMLKRGLSAKTFLGPPMSRMSLAPAAGAQGVDAIVYYGGEAAGPMEEVLLTDAAMDECWRVLKLGGRVCLEASVHASPLVDALQRRGFIVGSQEELDNGRLRLVARKPGMGDFQSLK